MSNASFISLIYIVFAYLGYLACKDSETEWYRRTIFSLVTAPIIGVIAPLFALAMSSYVITRCWHDYFAGIKPQS